MKKWHIEISQNGWEYTGWITFFADEVTRVSEDTLLVDGNQMKFDEEIKFEEITDEVNQL